MTFTLPRDWLREEAQVQPEFSVDAKVSANIPLCMCPKPTRNRHLLGPQKLNAELERSSSYAEKGREAKTA